MVYRSVTRFMCGDLKQIPIRFDIEMRVFPMARKVNHEAFKTKKKVDPPSIALFSQVTKVPDFPDRRAPCHIPIEGLEMHSSLDHSTSHAPEHA